LSFSSSRGDAGKDNILRALDRSITRVELNDGSWVSTQGLSRVRLFVRPRLTRKFYQPP
jgi:hypothetical protein